MSNFLKHSMFSFLFASLAAIFDHLPTALHDKIVDNNLPSRIFDDSERTTILAMSESDLVTAIINRDPLVRRYIKEISFYYMNEEAMTMFDENGSGQYDFYIIDESVVDSNNLVVVSGYFSTANSNIFKQFLGLATSATMNLTQTNLISSMISSIESDTVDPISARKSFRVVHPV